MKQRQKDGTFTTVGNRQRIERRMTISLNGVREGESATVGQKQCNPFESLLSKTKTKPNQTQQITSVREDVEKSQVLCIDVGV